MHSRLTPVFTSLDRLTSSSIRHFAGWEDTCLRGRRKPRTAIGFPDRSTPACSEGTQKSDTRTVVFPRREQTCHHELGSHIEAVGRIHRVAGGQLRSPHRFSTPSRMGAGWQHAGYLPSRRHRAPLARRHRRRSACPHQVDRPPDSILLFRYSINDRGQIAGVYLDADWMQHGFIATPMRGSK